MKSDTIAAIATGMTNSGISIIRVSGPEAFSIMDSVFFAKKGEKKISQQKTHTIHYGYIKDGEEIIDEVLVSVMRGPNSYTAEDVAERIDKDHGILFLYKKTEDGGDRNA